MAKTSISDLNDALFKMLEDLDGTDPISGNKMSPAQVDATIRRAEAVAGISDQILKVADLRIKATKLAVDHRSAVPMLVGIVSDVPKA